MWEKCSIFQSLLLMEDDMWSGPLSAKSLVRPMDELEPKQVSIQYSPLLMMKNGALSHWWLSTSTVNWSILTSLLPAVAPLGILLTLRSMKRGMWSPPECRILISQCANLMALFMNKCTHLTRSSSAQKCIRPVHFCLLPIIPNWRYCNICVFNSNLPKNPCSSFLTFRNIGLMMTERWALTAITAGDPIRPYAGFKLMGYPQSLAISRKKSVL